MNMREFNNWLQEKSEENVLESYEYIETNELMMPPKPGDIVLSQASAVFKTYQDRQGNWIQPKSRRDLYKTKTPMYVISGPPDNPNLPVLHTNSGRQSSPPLTAGTVAM
jgi:hypothetical protein